MGIRKMLLRALAKLVTSAEEDQAKTACGNLHLCAGLEAGIEGETQSVGQRRVERVRAGRVEEEGEEYVAVEGNDKDGGEVAVGFHNLTIETAGTEEEATEGLEAALDTQELEVEGAGGSKGEEGGGETQRALEALEFLTHDAESIGMTLVDARNGFNELSRLAMLWTVRHRWPAGARFAFNCYKHW